MALAKFAAFGKVNLLAYAPLFPSPILDTPSYPSSLKCEHCGERMKIIAFVMDATSIQKILAHLNEDSEPPKLHSARGPPDAEHSEEDVTEYQYDQTVSW